jgi:hypothetical protein
MDLSKFIYYPMWVKLVALIWFISSFILGAAFVFIHPTNREENNSNINVIKDTKLLIESRQLARDLLEFTKDFNKNSPQDPEKMTHYHIETDSFFSHNFNSRIKSIKREFRKRGITHEDLNNLNFVGVHTIHIEKAIKAINSLSDNLEAQQKKQ